MTTERKYIDVPFDIKFEDIKEDGTFKGHASLFDQVPDSYRDLVARGAFKETLSSGGRNKSGIAMLYQHRSDKIPGVWVSLGEDTKGLMAEGQLALDTQLGKEIHAIMRLGIKTGTFKFGLSIGYDALDFDYHTPAGESRKVRTLKKVDLWEISIVTFPAKIGTDILDVKKIDVKQIEEAKTERELEKTLREVEGLSECSVKLLVKMCKPFLREGVKNIEGTLDDGSLSEILDGLKKFNEEVETKEILGTLQKINYKEI